MNIIPASYEIFDIPSADDKMAVLKHIEKIARTCYKSEDKITDTSCVKIIENLKNRKHWAMLEHYVFDIRVDSNTANEVARLKSAAQYHCNIDTTLTNSIKFLNITQGPATIGRRPRYILSTSATTINYIGEAIDRSEDYISHDMPHINSLRWFLYNKYPELIIKPNNGMSVNPNDLKKFMFMTQDEVNNLDPYQRMYHEYMTVKFIVDRGVSHEIVRHRMASYAQESTRYCNYAKNGFGGEITVINPIMFRPNTNKYDVWKRACKNAEHEYFELLRSEATPQEARSVLPNSLKTELVMTTYLQEWVHFFKMRVPTAAHIQMREVSIPLFKQVINNKPEIFKQYKYFMNESEVIK